jgi:hypothetical protein
MSPDKQNKNQKLQKVQSVYIERRDTSKKQKLKIIRLEHLEASL